MSGIGNKLGMRYLVVEQRATAIDGLRQSLRLRSGHVSRVASVTGRFHRVGLYVS